jgi:hypothetical protein
LTEPWMGFLLGSWMSLSWVLVAEFGLAKVIWAERRPVGG